MLFRSPRPLHAGLLVSELRLEVRVQIRQLRLQVLAGTLEVQPLALQSGRLVGELRLEIRVQVSQLRLQVLAGALKVQPLALQSSRLVGKLRLQIAVEIVLRGLLRLREVLRLQLGREITSLQRSGGIGDAFGYALPRTAESTEIGRAHV